MENSSCEILDLSRRGLKKIEKAQPEESKTIINLILDQNELQRLDNIDTYTRVEHLSICNNFLLRMHGVSRLSNIRVLALNNNGILQIEGLKDMTFLKVLKLAGNNIKSIEHLNHNMQLEHLDLSNNQIAFIADISYLKSLKHLNLERNKIMDLRQCDRYLPTSLEHLGLAHNNIQDLNEVSHLVHLGKLESFTMQGNPCVSMIGKDKLGFEYRPFVVNWIMSLKSIDGFVVSAIESLKAEWLYSQGKGRHFHAGEHQQLCEYLASTCPLTAEALETEDHKKLTLILSKAQHHQQQLKDQTHSPIKPRLQSPRMQSRITSRHMGRSPDRMSSSYHSGIGSSPLHCQSMVRSCDASGLGLTSTHDSESTTPQPKQPQQTKPNNQSLEAASKMVPVPESLMSPDYQDPIYDIHKTIRAQNNTHNISNTSSNSSIHEDKPHRQIQQPSTVHKNLKGSPKLPKSATSSPKLKSKMEQRKGSLTNLKQEEKKLNGVAKDEKDSDVESDKAEALKSASNQRKQKKMSAESMAAVTIQKIWRGYRSRNLNKDTLRILHAIQAARARQHIQRLTCDMEATKAALESERKIQQLQMQAINALWKKVSTLQATDHKHKCTEPESADVLKQLTETCVNLQSQVAELQSCMQQVVNQVSHKNVVATQTDVIAVATPQDERLNWLKRPQSLPLNVPIAPSQQPEQITQTGQITENTNLNDSDSIEIERTESITIEDQSIEDSMSLNTNEMETKEKVLIVE